MKRKRNVVDNTKHVGSVKKKKRKSSSSKNTESLELSMSGCTAEGINSEKNEAELETSGDQLEKMHTWESYGLPKTVLLGLSSLGFMEPTHIQALTLPPAILGKFYLTTR